MRAPAVLAACAAAAILVAAGVMALRSGGGRVTPPARRVGSLQSDLAELCAPAMRGRGTLDGGSGVAAEFIAREFRSIGLETQFQKFEIVLPEVAPESSLTLDGASFAPGRDWLPLARLSPDLLERRVSALTAPGLAARISGDRAALRNRIAVERIPRPESPFRPPVPSLAERALACEDLGAVAVLFLPAAGDEDAGGEAACPQRVGGHAEAGIAKEPEGVRDWLRRRAWIGAAARAPRGPGGRVPRIPAIVALPGLSERLQARSQTLEGIPLELDWKVAVSRHSARNVVATATGDDPAAPALLLCAHYDSHGVRPDGAVYPGAADNAAGVAVLLATARALTGTRTRRSVIFAAFDAEELGLRGSRAFAAADPRVRGKLLAALNVDMAGRGPAGDIVLVGTAFAPDLAAEVRSELEASAFTVRTHLDWTFRHGSDHWPLHEAGVPSVLVTCSRFEEKDRPGDLPSLVDLPLLERTAGAVMRAATKLAGRETGLAAPVDAVVKAPWEK